MTEISGHMKRMFYADTRWWTVRTPAFADKSPPLATVSTIKSPRPNIPICLIETPEVSRGIVST